MGQHNEDPERKKRDPGVEHVRREKLWDTEWIDRECEQPETFAIGRVLEETLTWDIAYRLMLERQFEAMGFELNP